MNQSGTDGADAPIADAPPVPSPLSMLAAQSRAREAHRQHKAAKADLEAAFLTYVGARYGIVIGATIKVLSKGDEIRKKSPSIYRIARIEFRDTDVEDCQRGRAWTPRLDGQIKTKDGWSKRVTYIDTWGKWQIIDAALEPEAAVQVAQRAGA